MASKTMKKRGLNWAFPAKALRAGAVALLAMYAGAAFSASAEPSCAQVICLSPADGTPAPPECMMIRAVYFAIQVWDPNYDEDSTSQSRQAYLMTCTTARMQDLSAIDDKYGKLMWDPYVY